MKKPTSFPASPHGMLLSTTKPFIHEQEIKVKKNNQGHMWRPGQA
jgi:hypothetical protein